MDHLQTGRIFRLAHRLTVLPMPCFQRHHFLFPCSGATLHKTKDAILIALHIKRIKSDAGSTEECEVHAVNNLTQPDLA